jgi:hypothetical protein
LDLNRTWVYHKFKGKKTSGQYERELRKARRDDNCSEFVNRERQAKLQRLRDPRQNTVYIWKVSVMKTVPIHLREGSGTIGGVDESMSVMKREQKYVRTSMTAYRSGAVTSHELTYKKAEVAVTMAKAVVAVVEAVAVAVAAEAMAVAVAAAAVVAVTMTAVVVAVSVAVVAAAAVTVVLLVVVVVKKQQRSFCGLRFQKAYRQMSKCRFYVNLICSLILFLQ